MKRILFVDDEPAVLSGLKNALRRQRKVWEMHFAEGGEEALSRLASERFDVIVCDMRMPKIEGPEVLARAKEIDPEMVRIVLSGYAEQEAALRTVPVAHQFINKPCDTDALVSVIERACSIRSLIADDTLRSALGDVSKLPPVPKTYAKLTELLRDPDVDAKAIAALLEQDMSMTAKILQLVNSSFVVSAMPINSVQLAVARLGQQTVKNLVLSVEVFSDAELAAGSGVSLDAIQDHSARVAGLAKRILGPGAAGEAAFTAGMLHDLGTVLLAANMPEVMKTIIGRVRAGEASQIAAERERLGETHAGIGAYLLGLWGLPHAIVEAVAQHHEPRPGEPGPVDPILAVHVANALVEEGEGRPSSLDLAYLESRGHASTLDAWRALAAEVLDAA